ncbi:hypothetical protein [Sulfitobacter sp. PR48]|uniref:hypothetical protein n=1 Tax=Sulfitobacter sp. PR48 TaxID=3028383 RepID=UPI00237BA41C|nr:hypothetical protein [Sulfitobacter sp. PR48]
MFIYSAFDEDIETPLYHAEAMISAFSLRQHSEEPIVLHSNSRVLADRLAEPSWSPFSEVIVTDVPRDHPKLQKLEAIAASPFEKTVFLDTDTFILGDLARVFDFGPFDIAACQPPYRQSVGSMDAAVKEEWSRRWKLNSGVVFLNGSQRDVMDSWLADYKDRLTSADHPGKVMDQPSFQQALMKHQPDIFTLPNNYNFRLCFGGYLSGACFVVHTRAGVSIRPVMQNLNDLEAIGALIDKVASINSILVGVSFPTMADLTMAQEDLHKMQFVRNAVGKKVDG